MANKINPKKYLTPYVFYHNDLDGKAAAWLLHEWFVQKEVDDDHTDYQKYMYKGELKLGSVNNTKVVFIVDLCFTEKTYDTLLQICFKANSVVWIDHHDQSIKLLEAHPEIYDIPNLLVFVNDGVSGCLLTKTYITLCSAFNMYANPFVGRFSDIEKDTYKDMSIYIDYADFEEFFNCISVSIGNGKPISNYTINIPDWLAFIDDHDRYANMLKDQKDFIAGLSLENTSISLKMGDINGKQSICFNSDFWNFIDYGTEKYIESGAAINRYKEMVDYGNIEYTFVDRLPETNVKCMFQNARGNSYNFRDHFHRFDAVCLFYYDGKAKLWKYSIYSNPKSKFDCGSYCLKFGGGGHFHAAGFTSKEQILPI